MKPEQVRRVIERDYERFNAHELEWLRDDTAPGYVDHDETDRYGPGVDGTISRLEELFAAFPDARFELDKVIATEDHGVALARMIGTHRGQFAGIEPTGRTVEVRVFDVIRLDDDGRVTERWGMTDRLGMLAQLGAVPAGPSPASARR